MRVNRNNNRSLHNLNGKYAEDSVISAKEAEVKEWIRQQSEALMFFKYQQVREWMLINVRSVLGSAQLP